MTAPVISIDNDVQKFRKEHKNKYPKNSRQQIRHGMCVLFFNVLKCK